MKRMKKTEEKKIPQIGDQNPMHPDKKLVTRRDFISSGLIGLTGTILVPSVLSLILREQQVRASVPVTGPCPLIVLDCAGGFALWGNWIASGKSGAFDPLVLPSTTTPNYPGTGLANLPGGIDTTFGAAMAPGASQIYNTLTNIRPVTGVPATAQSLADNAEDVAFVQKLQNGLRMVGIISNTLSDSSSNATSIAAQANYYGAQGSKLKNGLGTQKGSGGNSQLSGAALVPASAIPVAVNNVQTLTQALSFGPALANVPTSMVNDLAQGLVKLSTDQLTALSNMKQGDQLAALANDGFKANLQYVTPGAGSMDPRVDPDCIAVYGISMGNGSSDAMVIEATIVMNALYGYSGPGVITVGGCDYHTGNQTQGDNKDTEIGGIMKRMFQLAIRKGVKFAFQIITDGGIYSDPMTRNWRGDDNGHSGMIMGGFDPAGNPPPVISAYIGNFTSGENANPATLSYNVANATQACVLNYLAMNNMVGVYNGPLGNMLGSVQVPLTYVDQLIGFSNFG